MASLPFTSASKKSRSRKGKKSQTEVVLNLASSLASGNGFSQFVTMLRVTLLSFILVAQAASFSTISRFFRPFGAVGRSISRRRMATVVETDTTQTYQQLLVKLKAITHLQRAQAVLNYDQLVFMPEAASAERGAQLAALATILHEKTTDSALKDLMDKVDMPDDPDAQKLLALERKAFVENERVPAELAARSAELSSSAYAAWVTARKENDFAGFADKLQECFDTAKEVAAAKRGDADMSIYTQMLDQFEVGMSQARIDAIFDEIQSALVPLIARVLASTHGPSTDPLSGQFPIDVQQKLNEDIVTALGFDTTHGRIDVSVHPFTTSFSPSDVRITSRFNDTEWYQGLAGSIHEGGHAMYEQNLGSSALSIDSALSMGTHESQSLFWERHVGLSKPFWEWATPKLQEAFKDFGYSPEEVYGAVNHVSQSLIRVEADELTYPLHVILRYQIERDIVEGKMSVAELPERWNTQMKEMLQIEVPSDTEGCLQDVHWPSLAIGYFPTYLIGSATAAQLAHYCRKDIPDFDDRVRAGDFAAIKAWLTDKVHRHGKRYASLDELLEDQVGEKLNPAYFISYLTEKYSDLYQL